MDNVRSQERLARIEGQLELILRTQDRAEDGRRRQYEAIETMGASIIKLDTRLGNVEVSLTNAAPTIEEFVKIKQRVKDAGALGKWLWVIGGLLVTAAFRFRSELLLWLKH